jgi:glucosamine--fructose-6-phosphate aminotransferase (isomerizing)
MATFLPTMTTHFEREIREQPEALERLLREGREDVERVAKLVRDSAPAWITIAARGTSDNAARFAQYVFGARNALSVALAAPSLYTIYGAPPKLEGSLVIGISQSGQSPDIAAVLAEGARQGALTLAITNDPSSPLAQAAEHRLALRAGAERAVAATKTYSTELMTIAMLSAALEGAATTSWHELANIPEQVARALDLATPLVVEPASRVKDAERFLVLGRGFNYATAHEIALKIKETSYVITEPYSFADFRHGPAALLERGFPVLLVGPSGAEDVSPMLDLLDRHGALVTAISDEPAVLSRARSAIALPSGVAEWLSPIVAIAPGQLFALALTRARGTDPDQPRGLSKVTETR